MIPTNWPEGVEIRLGAVFIFPVTTLNFSDNWAKYPETPFLVQLEKKRDGRCYLLPYHRLGEANMKLFVPKDILPGTKLVVDWVEGRCACALKMA